MTRTTLFQSNRSQAVRLPKDVAFPEGTREVTILREGHKRVIVPAGRTWTISSMHQGSISTNASSRRYRNAKRSDVLRYILDTNLCIRVLKLRPSPCASVSTRKRIHSASPA